MTEADADKYSLPVVGFDSELVELAFDLERLRGDLRRGTTPPRLIGDLHELFQILMSVISARIEGNRTTVFDAIDGMTGPEAQSTPSDSLREIRNIRDAMAFVDAQGADIPVTHAFVRELHRLSVDGLVREGDPTPGQYRAVNVQISQAAHVPPSHLYVHPEMSEWLDFVNRAMPTAQQMIHVAMAHHRFLWIHPFRNGNGRVSRLVSYAMLRRHGFESRGGLRAVNPTSVFGNDRDGYYGSLSAADDLSNEGTIDWCTFFVRGIHGDMERLTSLNDFEFVLTQLLDPVVDRLVAGGRASRGEGEAIRIAVRLQTVKAGDLESALPGTPTQRSVAIRSMVERGLLEHDVRGPRFYRVPITSGLIGRLVINRLDDLGFMPSILRDEI